MAGYERLRPDDRDMPPVDSDTDVFTVRHLVEKRTAIRADAMIGVPQSDVAGASICRRAAGSRMPTARRHKAARPVIGA